MSHHGRRDGDRERAFREAARAVAAWVVGREIIYIDHPAYGEDKQANSRWVAKTPKRLADIQLVLRGMRTAEDIGVTQKDLDNYQHDLRAFGEVQIEGDILITLAGSAACGRLDKLAGKTECADDRDEAKRLMLCLKEEDRLSEDEYCACSLDFVDTFQKWIQSLAELLIERHRIETKEFMEFVQAHPDLCEKRKIWNGSNE